MYNTPDIKPRKNAIAFFKLMVLYFTLWLYNTTYFSVGLYVCVDLSLFYFISSTEISHH